VQVLFLVIFLSIILEGQCLFPAVSEHSLMCYNQPPTPFQYKAFVLFKVTKV